MGNKLQPEFTVRVVRGFALRSYQSVAARMVKSLLAHYDMQLDEFLNFLVKEGYCDSDVYHQETPVIDEFLKIKNSQK